MPLKNVTTRSPLSISKPVRKPGATLVCTWPKSRNACHTGMTPLPTGISFLRVAISVSPSRATDNGEGRALGLAIFGHDHQRPAGLRHLVPARRHRGAVEIAGDEHQP